MTRLPTAPTYKVVFYNQSHIYEIYAKEVYQSDIYGFIEVEELVFNTNTQLVVDPGEEKLKAEFSGVKRSFIPMHNVVRIDEVDSEGPVKLIENGGQGKIAQFPMPPRSSSPEK